MSKINAVRLINVNYNNNAIRISDESFYMNGDSTLMSLQNGGGKSVLVQMLTAPFVHKRYRDTKDRPFSGYFTSNKPSFILVEWALDGGAGFVMTGLMVQRSADGGDNSEELELTGIVSEYDSPCIQDIHNLPVVEKEKKEIRLKSAAACRQLFETYKRDRSMKFFYYDLNQPAHSRQYFDKLMEYRIHYREWENIIKKVNVKESGLSELFSDCRDEKGLVEKWFLEAVESKLNRDGSRIRNFQELVAKYVVQYRENKSKFERRDTIGLFQTEAAVMEEKAGEYLLAEQAVGDQENRIAGFLFELKRLSAENAAKKERVCAELSELRAKIRRIEYEKLSAEVHELKEKKRICMGNRDMYSMEAESWERKAEEAVRTLRLLECAKVQERFDGEQREWDGARERLAVFQKKNEDMEPERRMLGGALRCFYERELEEKQELLCENQEQQKEKLKQAGEERKIAGEAAKAMLEETKRRGKLEERAQGYDRQEEEFNSQYKEALIRNILGEYEPGLFEIREAVFEKEKRETEREKRELGQKREQIRGEVRRLGRDLSDAREARVRLEGRLRENEKERTRLDGELNERRLILKYLELPETALFEREEILRAADKKLLQIDLFRRNLEKEKEELEKEWRRLTKGEVLELPDEIRQAFSGAGLGLVYGMEWLKKNGRSEEENRRIVRENPFLPYALILTKQEIQKLSGNGGLVNTSFPVPIIEREQLEAAGQAAKGGLVSFPGIHFYVLFNEMLLNGEKLQKLVLETERAIEKKKEAIEIRAQEYREYTARRERIDGQTVTRDMCEQVKAERAGLETELAKLDTRILKISEEAAEKEAQAETLDGRIRENLWKMDWQRRREADFSRLRQAFAAYGETKTELSRCKKEIERQKLRQELSEERQEQLADELKTLELARYGLNEAVRQAGEKAEKFRGYEEIRDQEIASSKEAGQREARFDALTEGVSRELRELEEQEQKARQRRDREAGELSGLGDKYGFSQKDWSGIRYDREEERHQETLSENHARKAKEKRRQQQDMETKAAALVSKLEDRTERIRRECGEEKPLSRQEILDQDFDGRRNKLLYEAAEKEKEEAALTKRQGSLEGNQAALAEYDTLPVRETVAWDRDFAAMNGEELREFQGILLRDYRAYQRDLQRGREAVAKCLNKMLRMEAFQDEFYKKPLEAMAELSGEAKTVLEQLHTVLASYNSLMEQLKVDISLVEREKERLTELLEEYVREVHANLGRIDANSTISVRGHAVKMLKIKLPVWEEQESMYRMQLGELLEKVTEKGIGLYEKGENAQEYFGTQITTKNLYDSMVGIGNVQIHLFKIEERREYPITWAGVAKNSGGEGFLSAFVILSCLLDYMRKDETDLFAERNEGKVLLMDNPFAQTNAAHLLRPLMDMAKKTNTQLICFTGLGGESIYSRFDNIYVLKLAAASLRSGLQYLRSDHLRGREPETIIPSRIQVTEQEEMALF